MSKHTPGPWQIRESDASGGFEVFNDGGPIAGVYMRHIGEDEEANARLIAAAPAMYELLRQILAGFEEHERFSLNALGTEGPEEIEPFIRLLLDTQSVLAQVEGAQ